MIKYRILFDTKLLGAYLMFKKGYANSISLYWKWN